MQRVVRLSKMLLPSWLYLPCRDLYHLFFGSSFVCPICRASAEELLPFGEDHDVLREKRIIGAGVRKALCPCCSSTDRERLVYLYVKKKMVSIKRKIRVLHV